MINDEEDLLRSIQSYVKDNLNARITAINTEKGDFTLDTITADDDHYVFAGETLDLPNHPFVNFAILDEIETENNQGDMISKPSFLVEVVFDNPKNPNVYFTSLRYMRALYETMLEYESSAIEADGVEITKAIPMLVTNASNRRQLVVSGVTVAMAIG